jgi:hypothetical protein
MGPLRRAAGDDMKTFRRAALLGGVLIVAGFATGFAGGFINGSGTGPESGKPATIEQLAAKTGCKPEIVNNKELRQGHCKTQRGRFVLMTFKSEDGRRTWLRGAKDYGGKYLVGTRWVIVGTGPDNVTGPLLEQFRGDLGGQIQSGRKHSGGNHNPKPHK